MDIASSTRILRFYAEAGVDEAIAAAPVNWFAGVEARRNAPKPQAARRELPDPRSSPREPDAPQRQRAAPVAPDTAVMDARERAAKARTLAELEAALQDYSGCPLKATAKNTCFKRGSDKARIMLIGEGPGRDEDIQGIPFVGRAGQLLDKMLAAINLGENDVYITNVVYWRPPGNRTPTAPEIQACAPFLDRQVELLDPEFIVLIGGPASHHILDTTEGITRIRGSWRDREIGGKTRRAIPILHPAYLLRTPAAKRLAWRDMLTIESALNGENPQ